MIIDHQLRTNTLLTLANIEGEALRLKSRFALGLNDPDAEEWDDCGYLTTVCYRLVEKGAILSEAAYETLKSIGEAIMDVCAPHWLDFFPEKLPPLERLCELLKPDNSSEALPGTTGKILNDEKIIEVYTGACPQCSNSEAEHTRYIKPNGANKVHKIIICQCTYYFDSADWE